MNTNANIVVRFNVFYNFISLPTCNHFLKSYRTKLYGNAVMNKLVEISDVKCTPDEMFVNIS